MKSFCDGASAALPASSRKTGTKVLRFMAYETEKKLPSRSKRRTFRSFGSAKGRAPGRQKTIRLSSAGRGPFWRWATIFSVAEERPAYRVGAVPRDQIARLVKELEAQMKQAARSLEFERAALLRDQIIELRRELVGDEEGLKELAAMAGGRRYQPSRRRRR